jgi:YcxB-like protein
MKNRDSAAHGDVSVSGTLTSKEYKKFSSFHTNKWVMWFVISTYILFFSLLSYILYSPGDIFNFGEMASLLFVSSTVSILIALLFFLYAKGIIRFKAAREYKSDHLIKNEITYTFSENGINQKRGKSINYIDWNEIVFIKEYSPMFLIYVSKNKAIVLPKRFFESDEQIKIFKNMIKENVPLEKNLLPDGEC